MVGCSVAREPCRFPRTNTSQWRASSERSRAKRHAGAQIVPAGSGREGGLPLSAELLLLSWPERGGGESGADLTRSQLVTEDVDGNKIGVMVRNGRPEKGMPHFDFSDQQMAGLVAFIHTQQNALHLALHRVEDGGIPEVHFGPSTHRCGYPG